MKKLLILLLLISSFCFCVEKMQLKERGQMTLSNLSVMTIADADTYYPVSGNFTDGNIKNFTLSSAGILTYIGYGNVFLLNGVTDIQVNKLCKITFALFKNGALCEDAQTPHTFAGADRIQNMSIAKLVQGKHNDSFQVYAKSSVENTNLSIENLTLTMWGR